MYRLRRKSDAKRGQVPDPLQLQAKPPEPLPTLPPADDFRTSLILPDVLRASSGVPIALDDLKSKFAEQRARGSRNQVTEEEEDMILEALGRLHSKAARTQEINGGDDAGGERQVESQDMGISDLAAASLTRESVHSAATSPTMALHSITSMSSLSPVKGSHASRRMSNNLFGSGKLRDQTYMRSTNHGRRAGGSRTVPSVTPSDSMMSMSTVASSRAENSMYSDSLRPSTPDGSSYTPSNSVPSSPSNDQVFEKQRSGRSALPDSDSESTAERKDITTRLSKTLSPDVLRRASLALDEVIRELEEEGDDEIVMERTALPHIHGADVNGSVGTPAEHRTPLASPADYEPGTALSDDRVVVPQQNTFGEMRSHISSPAPRLPGYIPGMPRPMTPRDSTFDSDDQTPSNTPRATSPRLPGATPPSPRVPHSISTSLYRSSSSASSPRQSPAPVATPIASTPPLFFNRNVNGRFTPEDRQRSANASPVTDLFDSSLQSRRHPTSPLSGPAYRPLASSPSRPGTPSNVTWNTNPIVSNSHALTKSMDSSLHSKNGSTVSVSDVMDGLERSKSTSRSLRSPALPESPFMDRSHGIPFALDSEYRPPSAMSGVELGSPVQIANRPLRSPTPTHGRQKSPTVATFPEALNGCSSGDTSNPSRRSSKQNHHYSFSLGSSQGLLLSPIANSSRSSIESAGSSYHTWDEDHSKDRLYGLLSNLDADHTEWHDISASDKSVSSTPGTSPYESLNLEDAVRKNVGLTRGDFMAIQDRLVKAAIQKVNTPDGRVRANSLRRRRPSTSQSNYSYSGAVERVASPAPPAQVAVSNTTSRVSDHNAKVNALLESVVDSIESPRLKSPQHLPTSEPHAQSEQNTSSPLRRQRALADALFGSKDSERPSTPAATALLSSGMDNQGTQVDTANAMQSSATLADALSGARSPVSPAHNISVANGSHVDATRLAMEVQQRAEAATAALRTSPSIPKIGEPSSTAQRKRINPRQISSPKLVSASTSLDTIPLPSAAAHSPAGTSTKVSRFRKLTGSLRAKDTPTEPQSPASAPLPSHPTRFSPTAGARFDAPHANARSQHRYQSKSTSLNPSPSTSATPGFRGLISRLRKPRAAESYLPSQKLRVSPQSTAMSPTAPSSSHGFVNAAQVPRSAPALQTYFQEPPSVASRASLATSGAETETISPSAVVDEPESQSGDAALRQLFAAASDLGLDQTELKNLLARSPSASSKFTRATSLAESRKSRLPGVRENSTIDRARSPSVPRGRPSIDGYANRPSQDSFQPAVLDVPEVTPRPRREAGAESTTNPIIRRTIIFPSDPRSSTMDLNTLMRKQSAARRRRSAGATSTHSNRSIHDRVPTPPPQKHAGRRFSSDGSPPVPYLPTSVGAQAEQLVLPGQMEPSNSAYESLYEMYTGDGKTGGAGTAEAQTHPLNGQTGTIPESGPALEVIELANGEMIWNIVNGLRDDDDDSLYGDRHSFVSEYSRRESVSEGLKLFFKGHEKKGSKSSNTSAATRRRHLPKPAFRPETKVFFSSSAQIGQLIENLSRGVDAGTFDIAPQSSQAHLGHSTSSSLGSESELRWTLEERRLQQMLGSIGPTQ